MTQLGIEFGGEISGSMVNNKADSSSKCFSIQPKVGHIPPGETQTIRMSYLHNSKGPHRVSAILSFKNGDIRVGNDICLNLLGHTILENQKYLLVESSTFQLKSLPLGISYPPIQYFKLENCSGLPIEIQVDNRFIKKVS